MDYKDMPLTGGTLSLQHKTTLLLRLDDLLKFLNCPGDWGYRSKLGVMVMRLSELRRDIANAPVLEEESSPATPRLQEKS